jgi:Holliday junction resolvasome RuvABC endonuclease subunit
MHDTRRVLGVDVGPSRSGWGVVDSTGRGSRARFVAGGMVASEDLAIVDLLERHAVDSLNLVVAIESPEGHVHHQARGAMLMATANVAGRFRMASRMLRLPLVEMSAQSARRALCGKGVRGVPGDRVVKMALGVYVEGLPSRSSTHVRDALLVACVALFQHARR